MSTSERWYFVDSYASREEALASAQKHRAARSFGPNVRIRVRKGGGFAYAGSRTPWVVEWRQAR